MKMNKPIRTSTAKVMNPDILTRPRKADRGVTLRVRPDRDGGRMTTADPPELSRMEVTESVASGFGWDSGQIATSCFSALPREGSGSSPQGLDPDLP